MEMKWTKGPWKQSLPDDTAIIGADGWPVCETGVHQDYDEHFERMEADARLIAAAPELFEALQALVGPQDDPLVGWGGHAQTSNEHFRCEFCHEEDVDCTKVPHKDDCPVVKARAVLAKATGEQA